LESLGPTKTLENNKQTYIRVSQRPRFLTDLSNLDDAGSVFVDTLTTNAGSPLSPAERSQLVSDLTSVEDAGPGLESGSEDPDCWRLRIIGRLYWLILGYLRRNPNDTPDSDYTGYDFWLGS